MPSDWVNFQDYLELNRPSADAMAERLVGGVNAHGNEAEALTAGLRQRGARQAHETGGPVDLRSLTHYDQAAKAGFGASRDARLLGHAGGQQALLSRAYGGPGVSGLDAALAGSAGAGQFAEAQKRWGGLEDSLDLAQEHVDAATVQARERRAAQAAASKKREQARAQAAAEEERRAREAEAQQQRFANYAPGAGEYGAYSDYRAGRTQQAQSSYSKGRRSGAF